MSDICGDLMSYGTGVEDEIQDSSTSETYYWKLVETVTGGTLG